MATAKKLTVNLIFIYHVKNVYLQENIIPLLRTVIPKQQLNTVVAM